MDISKARHGHHGKVPSSQTANKKVPGELRKGTKHLTNQGVSLYHSKMQKARGVFGAISGLAGQAKALIASPWVNQLYSSSYLQHLPWASSQTQNFQTARPLWIVLFTGVHAL